MRQLKMNRQQFLQKAVSSFPFFSKYIFFKGSFKEYECPEHFLEWSKIFQENNFVSLMSARKHLKSTLLYSYLMWRIFRQPKDKILEILYLSYNERLAAYHVAKIKEAISRNPFFIGIEHRTDAESVLNCNKIGGKGKISIAPAGILSFKRGMHPDEV